MGLLTLEYIMIIVWESVRINEGRRKERIARLNKAGGQIDEKRRTD